jgi:hypothetical protein
MRGVPPIALPESAAAKLSALRVQQMAAEDAARAVQSRLSGFGRVRDAADQELCDRLAAEADRLAARHRRLSALVHHINQWWMELRGVVLESAPAIAIKLKDGQTLVEAIEATRGEIAALNAQLATVRRAPLPAGDQRQLAEAFVARQASMARPSVAVVGDQVRVAFRDSVVGATDDVLALACWIQPEAVLTALTREIEQMPTPINPLPANERKARVAELEQQSLELERREEALIMRAAGDGVELLRRPDAAPAAVLGVVIVAKAAAPQQVA